MNPDPACPDADTIAAWAARPADDLSRERFELHMDDCERCRARWIALEQGWRTGEPPAGMPASRAGADPSDDPASIPDRLGRYLVIAPLGTGGIGRVFAAYDPKLDRKVAIKLLRPEHGSERDRARLQQEARTLARLAHANVVVVFDVGTIDGDLFIAMELIDGDDLQRWAEAGDRSWREVVDVYVQAGRGLAAAHAAGVVHRDFKPHNAMIDADGVVKVLDFGLAREQPLDPSDAPPTSPAAPHGLTQTGAVMGTPAYMSPEQFRGADVDAASDQFNFCVALHEALYGERPFDGHGLRHLARAVTEGRIREPRQASRAPRWLHRLVRRGLAPKPDERHPSMASLIRDLERGARTGRRRAAVAASTIGLAAAATAAGTWWYEGRPCTSGEERTAEVWNDERRAALEARFAASRRSYARSTWERVEQQLGERSRAWAAMYDGSCRATHVHHEQSPELLDLRTACLDQRLAELRSLVEVFGEASDETIDRAIGAVQRLPSLDRCANARALRAVTPAPQDEPTRRRLEGIRARLADARALRAAGRTEGLELSERALDDAEALGYAPLLSEAIHVHGRALDVAGRIDEAVAAQQRAFALGLESGDDLRAADGAAELVSIFSERKGEPARALEWLMFADAAVGRAGGDPNLERRLRLYEGFATMRTGDFPRAREVLEPLAAELNEAAEGDPMIALGAAHAIGNTYLLEGDTAAALASLQAVEPRAEAALDPRHPNLAVLHDSIGSALRRMGRRDQAHRAHVHALEIREQLLGSDHVDLTDSLVNVSRVIPDDPNRESEEALLRRALTLLDDHPDDPRVAVVLNNLGEIHIARGEPADALTCLERARRNIVDRLGARHPELVDVLLLIGQAQLDLTRYEDAQASFEDAEQLARATVGDEHPYVGLALSYQGDAYVSLGDAATAISRYRRAIEVFESVAAPDEDRLVALNKLAAVQLDEADGAAADDTTQRALAIAEDPSFVERARADPSMAQHRGDALFLRARVIANTGTVGAIDRSRALAERARPLFAALGRRGTERTSKLDRWLSELGPQ